MRSKGAMVAVLLISAAQCGCSYSMAGSLPAGLRTVWIPVFGNTTRAHWVEAEVTSGVVSEFQAEGALRPAPKHRADCALRGEITSYRKTLVRKDSSGAPLAGQAVLECELSLEDLRDGKMVFEGVGVSSTQTDATAGQFHLDRGESERLGRERAVRALAKAVVRSVVEHW